MAEVPLVLEGGEVLRESAGVAAPRAALCVTDAGRVLVARGEVSSFAPLADALKRAGCTRAVGLDRGSHEAAFVSRAGTSAAPVSRYDDTVLWAIAQPLAPRGFRFDAQAQVAAATKK
jgi:hypothetical protein